MVIFIPIGVYYAYRKYFGLRKSFGKLPALDDMQLPYYGRRGYDFSRSFSQRSKAKIPLFDPFPIDRSLESDDRLGTVIPVIAPRRFEFIGVDYDDLPKATPIVTIRDSRSPAAPAPRTIYIRPSRDKGYRSEYHRRRRDKKVGRGYRRLLSFVNRTYGRFDEFAEVADAFGNNVGPMETLTALAVNEGVDYAYGYRSRALRKHIYSKRWYKLPIGIDAIVGGYGMY